jgi:uncharacterized protein (DUF1697 family)
VEPDPVPANAENGAKGYVRVMRYVAFLRNVNQGQRGHPSTADILAGFADAGCPDAAPFQSNGTIVFESHRPAAVADAVARTIASRSGLERDAFWIAFEALASVVDVHGGVRDPRRFEFTLHGGGIVDPADPLVAHEAGLNRCDIVDSGPGWALVRNKVEGEGHATPTLEHITGGHATSRGLPTLMRLVNRFAPDR